MLFKAAPFALFFLWFHFSCSIALEKSFDLTGDAIITPVFSTNSGFDTLLKVSHTGSSLTELRADQPLAVKALVHDSVGSVIASFSIYLDVNDTWVGAISSNGSGQAVLRSADDTCLLGGQEVVQPISEVMLSTAVGYLTFFEMGRIKEGELDSAFRTDDDICGRLADEWNSGIWATDPDEGLDPGLDELEVFTTLVNVQSGTMYDVPSVALTGFNGQTTHRRPADPSPNLATPSLALSEGVYHVFLCITPKECTEYELSDPLTAVATALLTTGYRGDINQEPGLDATTEWVILNPLNPFLAERMQNDPTSTIAYLSFASFYPRTGVPLEEIDVFPFIVEKVAEMVSGGNLTLSTIVESLTQYSLVFEADDPLVLNSSHLLGLPAGNVFSSSITGTPQDVNGTLVVHYGGFPSSGFPPELGFIAWPSVAVGLQEFKNGTLTTPSGQTVLSNYGRSSSLQPFTSRSAED